MSATYFWDGKKVITVPYQVWAEEIEARPELRDMPCVDTYRSTSDPGQRYGMFRSGRIGWTSVPVEEFPAEFRMHLLLLGVS